MCTQRMRAKNFYNVPVQFILRCFCFQSFVCLRVGPSAYMYFYIYTHHFNPPFAACVLFEGAHNGHYLRAISRSLFVLYAEDVIGLDGGLRLRTHSRFWPKSTVTNMANSIELRGIHLAIIPINISVFGALPVLLSHINKSFAWKTK